MDIVLILYALMAKEIIFFVEQKKALKQLEYGIFLIINMELIDIKEKMII
jgi:hypothetical protein